jgi:hypothetical protein
VGLGNGNNGAGTKMPGTLAIGSAQNVTGAVTQNTGTTVEIARFTASTANSIDLATITTNKFDYIDSIARGGAFSLRDSQTAGTLTVADAITSGTTANSVSIETGAGRLLDVEANISATGATGAVNLTSTGLTVGSAANATETGENGITVTAGTGTVTLGSGTNSARSPIRRNDGERHLDNRERRRDRRDERFDRGRRGTYHDKTDCERDGDQSRNKRGTRSHFRRTFENFNHRYSHDRLARNDRRNQRNRRDRRTRRRNDARPALGRHGYRGRKQFTRGDKPRRSYNGAQMVSLTTAVSKFASVSDSGAQTLTITNTKAGGLEIGSIETYLPPDDHDKRIATLGTTTVNGAVSITETAGSVTANKAINAGASTVAVTLDTAEKPLTVGAATVTGNGGITLTADKMDVSDASAALASNAGHVTLSQMTNTVAISLGSATDAAARRSNSPTRNSITSP